MEDQIPQSCPNPALPCYHVTGTLLVETSPTQVAEVSVEGWTQDLQTFVVQAA